MFKSLAAAAAACVALAAAQVAVAGISYTSVGGMYTENFNSLPLDLVQNGNIEVGAYTDGWQDDVNAATSPEHDISVLGWHLFHPLSPTENGFNNNQRVRVGPGANTGSFWLFGTANSDADKALGSVGSTTVAPDNQSMYRGLQLINNTGQTLHSFTLTFDGEQWRDGQSSSGETLIFDYSTVATDALWTLPGSSIYTAAPTLNFTSPVVAGTSSGGTAVVGNAAGLVAGITATVTGFSWEPGKELWLRWGDPQLAGNADDGLAIDNVVFTATTAGTGSSEITSVAPGPNPSSAAATWSDSLAPSAGKKYRIQGGHTVTVDSAFAGDYLRVSSGGTATFNDAGNGADIRVLLVDSGGTLSETATGDFRIGDPLANTALGIMTLGSAQTFSMDAGSDFQLAMAVHGDGDMTFNSNGAGSDLILQDVSALNGTIKFEGTGDLVRLVRSQAFDHIEMNSTGANTLRFEHTATAGGGVIIFNQPGRLEHTTTFTSTNVRLVQKSVLEANAAVTVDLTQPYATGERRLSFSDSVRGAGDITVEGATSNPLPAGDRPDKGTAAITLNEFELGSTGDSTGNVPSNTYSGTFTAHNYVNVELRNSLPAAKLVIQDNARLEMGRQVVGTAKTTSFGEIDVQAGGTLEVGFEQYDIEVDSGNHVGHLNLVTTDGRSGGLTLADGDLTSPGDVNSEPAGSMVVMQLNGKNPNEFDTIAAAGSIHLDGVLKVLINPSSSLRGATPIVNNPVYTPALGDEITLISSTSSAFLPTDFDHSGTVNDADLTQWKNGFTASSALGDSDGDGDSDGADFLNWQSTFGQTGGGGGISGTFDRVVFVDVDNAIAPATPATDNPDTSPAILVNSTGVMASLGLKFQIQYSTSAVKLVVVSSPITAVPEPSAAALAALCLLGSSVRRRWSAA